MDEGKVILLVDDDLTLREMYDERLKAEGFDIIQASNGDEAMRKAKESKPNIILLDIMMPKVNGFDVLKDLKADPDLKDIPVIVLTALIQDVDHVRAKNWVPPTTLLNQRPCLGKLLLKSSAPWDKNKKR